MLPTEIPVTMQFWNWQTLESAGAGSCYDGGILEISTNGGSTWTYLPTTVMQTDPYDGPVSGLGGLEGWCGDPQDWLRSVVDLDAYAGQTVRFRFRLGTDVLGRAARAGTSTTSTSSRAFRRRPTSRSARTPGSATICAGDDAEYTVNVGAILGFTNPVDPDGERQPGRHDRRLLAQPGDTARLEPADHRQHRRRRRRQLRDHDQRHRVRQRGPLRPASRSRWSRARPRRRP